MTVIRLEFGIALVAPFLRTPPATVTPAPPKLALVFAPERTRVPGPALVIAVEPAPTVLVMTPPMVPVTRGLETVMVWPMAPRAIAPDRVRELTATVPPKVKPPLMVVALLTVRTAVPDKTETPSSRMMVPVP